MTRRMLLVLTTESLLFVVFTAIVWYEFFFSMSPLELLITLRVLILLGGIYALFTFAGEWLDDDEDGDNDGDCEGEGDSDEDKKTITLCKRCSKHVHKAMAADVADALDATKRPVEDSDEFADLLEPGTKQIPTPK